MIAEQLDRQVPKTDMPNTAHIVFVAIELLIPASASLKSKRRVLNSLKDKIRARLNASVAEIDYLEQWQRSVIGVSMIGNDRIYLEKGVNVIAELLRGNAEIETLNFRPEWL